MKKILLASSLVLATTVLPTYSNEVSAKTTVTGFSLKSDSVTALNKGSIKGAKASIGTKKSTLKKSINSKKNKALYTHNGYEYTVYKGKVVEIAKTYDYKISTKSIDKQLKFIRDDSKPLGKDMRYYLYQTKNSKKYPVVVQYNNIGKSNPTHTTIRIAKSTDYLHY